MICIAREYLAEFFPNRNRPKIRLRADSTPMILISGCRKERIDAIIGPGNRIKRIIVRTRSSRCG